MMRGMMRGMEFSQRMREAREATGLSPQQVIHRTRPHLSPPDYFEVDVIRRIENPRHRNVIIEDRVKPAVIQALAKVYGKEVKELSEVGEHNVEILRELVRSRCFATAA